MASSSARLLLRNLLDNALRYNQGQPQPLMLTLQVEPAATADAAGPGLRLTLRDHGPGVPEAQLAQLAQPFFRPDAARSRSDGGVGLGLYLCRLVAEAHGGRLHLRNAAPGLEVTVILPAYAIESRAN